MRNISRSAVTSEWVNHTHEVILETQAVRSARHLGNAALRTYLLTGRPREQADAREAFGEMLEHLEVLRALLGEEPAARASLAEVSRLVTARAEAAPAMAARRSRPGETPAALVAADTAVDIRRHLDRIKAGQMALLAERDTASCLQAQSTRLSVWAGVILDFLLLAGVVWLIRDDLEARRRVVAMLETANRDLDAKVQARTAELAGANEVLLTENLERRWANQALEHQHCYDQLTINSINDLVLVLTKVMNISRINPAVVAATGFEGKALINQPFAALVELPSDAGTPGVDPLAQALKVGRELRAPGLMKCRDGRKVPVRVAVYPLRDGDKVVGGVVTLELRPAGETTI